jgi:hypothetical protein
MLSKKIALMKLLEEVKKSSSKRIKTKGEEFAEFHWQDGYRIIFFSISLIIFPAIFYNIAYGLLERTL